MYSPVRPTRQTTVVVLFSIISLCLAACSGEDSSERLVNASMGGKADVIRRCLEKGADVNAADKKFNATALMWAAHNGHVEALNVLLANGADMDRQGSRGETALWFAAQKGQLETLKILVENGADINTVGRDGYSPIAIAEKNGHSDIVDYLKSAGAAR